MKPKLELAGQRYGRLLVQKRSKIPQYWVCLCDCGKICDIKQANLRVGVTRSCGCLFKEVKAAQPPRPWTEAEIVLLKTLDVTPGVLSLELNRTRANIDKKRRELGLLSDNRKRHSSRTEAKHTKM